MAVKAKFYCGMITDEKLAIWDHKTHEMIRPDQDCKRIEMHAVCDNNYSNASWNQNTPTGKLEMVITNPDAYNQFEVGKEYYLTIEKAEMSL